MTETEWLTSTNPLAMLEFLRGAGKASDRKVRLFAVACCRRIWPRMTDALCRHAVELAERSADEPVSERELDIASGLAEGAFEDSLTDEVGELVGDDDPRPAAGSAASYASSPGRLEVLHLGVVLHGASDASLVGAVQETAAQAAILRDLFGDVLRPPRPLAPAILAWNDGLVRRLAEDAYDRRDLPEGTLDPVRIGVLADALEDAGCPEVSLLDHLRLPGDHVRGCFALDLLLGKS